VDLAAEAVNTAVAGVTDWRRPSQRETDLVAREIAELVPLSVATDRIGLAPLRCAGLLARPATAGQPVAAATEAWIALPTGDLAGLLRGRG
jgi:hypothetical protein